MKTLDIWSKMSVAKKASIALVFAKFCQKGIAMVSTPVFTRIMEPEQYGIITNFTSWQNIIVIIATLNLSQGVFNNGMLEFEKDRDRFTTSVLFLANFCTIVCFGLYLFFVKFLKPYIGLSDAFMLLMFIYMLVFPAYSYWSCRQRFEFKYKVLTILTIGITLLQMVFGIFFVLWADMENQAFAKVFATEIVTIIVGMVIYVITLCRTGFGIKYKYVKYAFKFNIFLVPHFLAMNVLASGDKVMITNMVGKAQTAIYGVSYTAASTILIFWQAIEASWTPWLYEHLKDNNKEPVKERANQIITMFAVISVLCMLFAPEVMMILASGVYMEGIYVVPSVTAGVYFMAVYALYMRVEYYSKKTGATMVGSVAVAVANVVLNYIFIQLYGYRAAGYTTLVCYIFLYLFHFWYTRFIGMKNIYNDKYIAILSGIMILITFFINLTYQSIMLRYGLITVLAVLLVIFRKQVIEQVKALF